MNLIWEISLHDNFILVLVILGHGWSTCEAVGKHLGSFLEVDIYTDLCKNNMNSAIPPSCLPKTSKPCTMVTHFLFVLSTRFTVTREDCAQEKTSAWDSTSSNNPHNSPTSFGSPFPTWLPIVLIYPWQKYDRCVLPWYLQEILGQPCRPHLVVLCQLVSHYARSTPWKKTTHLQLHHKACYTHPSGCHVTKTCICLDYRWTRSTRVSFLVACIVAVVPMLIPLVASCILKQSSQSPVFCKWTI